MKLMTLQETISYLGKREQRSRRQGYMMDAVNFATKRHILILLAKGKQKRNPTSYQLKVGRFLKEGKTIQEAHKLARGILVR